MEQEVDLTAEMLADRLARGLADGFQARSSLTDHDRFLAVALNQDCWWMTVDQSLRSSYFSVSTAAE